jgi:hypothetical protein
MANKTKRFDWIFLVLPFVLFALCWKIAKQMFPIFSGPLEYDMDPAYQYLFNAVFILNGDIPYHIDHPGTPLQLLCALVIFLTWAALSFFGHTSTQIALSVANDPELYLQTITAILICINAWGVYFLGIKVHRSTKNIGLSLFCQLAIFYTSILLFRIVYPSPESLVIFITVCLLGLFSPLIFKANIQDPISAEQVSPIWVGILCGIGIAVKLNFVPVLGLLLLFNKKKQFITSLFFVCVGLAIGILPILKKAGDLFGWVINIATHSGVHGSGQKGIFTFTNFDWHVSEMYKTFTFFYFVLAALIAVFLLKLANVVAVKIQQIILVRQENEIKNTLVKSSNIITHIRVPLVFGLICTFQTLVVLKHPGLYYMVPVLPIGFIGAAWLAQEIFSIKFLKIYNKKLGIILFLIGFIWCGSVGYQAYISMSTARLKQNEALTKVQQVLKQYPEAIVITTYRSNLPLFSVMYGLAPPLAPSLGSTLNPLFNNFYMWDGGIKKLLKYGEPLIPIEILNDFLKQGKTVLLSTPMLYPDLKVFTLEPLVAEGTQQLYKIKGIKN